MDIAMSSQGIEARAPMLDHTLLEWTQGLPSALLVQGRQKKVLLRRSYATELPAEVLTRKKHGFGAPVHRWLAGPLLETAKELLPGSLIKTAPERDVTSQRQWSLLTFASWAQAWGARW